MKSDEIMSKAALPYSANRRTRTTICIDQVVGDILSGWRYDISGLSPAMRKDYDQHLADCAHCRRRQHVARTIDVLLITVSTLSIAAFLLAAVIIHRLEVVAHIGTVRLHLNQAHVIAISLQAVAISGIAVSALLWLLVAIATPLPGFLGDIVQQRIPADIRDRFTKNENAA
jgi:hypothetical protein